MNSFLDTSITYEIGRQRRASLESVARRHRLSGVRGGGGRRRRSRDPGPPGRIVEFPVRIAPVSKAA